MPEEPSLHSAPPVDRPTQSLADPATSSDGGSESLAEALAPSFSRRYVLGNEIARGGMGAVFRATDTALQREIAVKVLHEKYAPTSAAARRFDDEARITSQLQHPNIPAVHDLGVLPDGRPFLAMKLIKGQTLEDLLNCRPDPTIDRGRFIAIFEQVCQGVAYAHAHEVIHRDLKPANIMVGSFGEVQVMDWGLAKVLRTSSLAQTDPRETTAETEIKSLRDSEDLMTQAGSVLGTPAFMPPEQAIGAVHEVDCRSDVFGLGGVLAVILTGRPPFVGDTGEMTRILAAKGKVQDCFARLDASGADPELVTLCKKCLTPDKEDRPADAVAVAAAVAALRTAADERARQAELDRVRVEGEQVAAAVAIAERRKRQRVWLGAATALGLAALGGLGALAQVERRANVELSRKNAALDEANARERQRFGLAMDAIGLFTGDVSEDLLLKERQFVTLRTRLLRGAGAFYTRLEELLRDRNDSESQAALGRAYHELAELTARIGSIEEALQVYEKAKAVRLALADQPGADAGAVVDLARTLNSAALAASERGDLVVALGMIEMALSRLNRSDKTNHLIRGETGRGEYTLGVALIRLSRFPEALAAFTRARTSLSELAESHPEVLEYRRYLSWCDNDVGLILLAQNRLTEAAEAFERSLKIKAKIAQDFPEVAEYQRDLSLAVGNFATVFDELGRPVEALRLYEEERTILTRTISTNPTITQLQKLLATNHLYTGRLHVGQNRLEKAAPDFDQGMDLLRKLIDSDPTNVMIANQLGFGHLLRGSLRIQVGNPAAGVTDLRQAVRIMDESKLSDSDDRYELARALALLAGFGREAKHGVTPTEAVPFAERAMSVLRDLTSTGWNRWDRLMQPSFDSLRGRDDFEKLLAEMQAKTQKPTETAPTKEQPDR